MAAVMVRSRDAMPNPSSGRLVEGRAARTCRLRAPKPLTLGEAVTRRVVCDTNAPLSTCRRSTALGCYRRCAREHRRAWRKLLPADSVLLPPASWRDGVKRLQASDSTWRGWLEAKTELKKSYAPRRRMSTTPSAKPQATASCRKHRPVALQVIMAACGHNAECWGPVTVDKLSGSCKIPIVDEMQFEMPRTMAIALVRNRPLAPRWPYILPGLAGFLFVGPAYEDDGWRSAAIYLAIIGLSIAQAVRPTVLAWTLLVTPFLVYGIEIARHPGNLPLHEWLIFLFVGFAPVLAMLVAHPWRRQRRNPDTAAGAGTSA
jgi:hypothetical protein